MNNTNGRSGKTLKGCGLALVIAIAAIVILPIVAFVFIRVFGHKVEQRPAHIATEAASPTSEVTPK